MILMIIKWNKTQICVNAIYLSADHLEMMNLLNIESK